MEWSEREQFDGLIDGGGAYIRRFTVCYLYVYPIYIPMHFIHEEFNYTLRT